MTIGSNQDQAQGDRPKSPLISALPAIPTKYSVTGYQGDKLPRPILSKKSFTLSEASKQSEFLMSTSFSQAPDNKSIRSLSKTSVKPKYGESRWDNSLETRVQDLIHQAQRPCSSSSAKSRKFSKELNQEVQRPCSSSSAKSRKVQFNPEVPAPLKKKMRKALKSKRLKKSKWLRLPKLM